ncbi:MAG: transketolase [Verrucomicrobia bacterium]|nr:transketolase [Verrucomicrobiota bacterium]
MAEDKTVVEAAEVPPLAPLKLTNRLAKTPSKTPQYAVKVKDSKGKEVVLGDPRATRACIAIMDMHAVSGGAACHWGGPAAFAEIISAIHGIMFSEKGKAWHEAYNFVNDAGHAENGIYALRANYGYDGMSFEDLKGFRSINSKLTGHGESHLNPEGVFLSNGPLSSSIPQAEGLALADKVADNDRLTFCVASDGASMEGEAKEAFASIPGLAAKGKMNPFVLVVSDNDTKLSGRISDDSFDMKPTFEAMSTLGWNVISVSNGNDIQEVFSAVEDGVKQAKSNPRQPVFIWVKTIKGYGVKATEESSSGGHGFPLKNSEKIVDFVNEIYDGGPPEEIIDWAKTLREQWEQKEESKKSVAPSVGIAPAKKEKVQAGLARAIVQAAKEGYPLFSITADVPGSTGIAAFHKSFPDRFIDVGVAEANMVSVAAGFAKKGFIPVVDTFAQFGITKGNLPLMMAALSQAPVIGIFSHAGFQDAADGASHQATHYLAAVSAIPHTVVVSCSCATEAEALMRQAIYRYAEARERGEDGESVIFFVGREGYPVAWLEEAQYEWGKAQVLNQGKDVAIIACGPLVGKAIQASKKLQEKGLSATVINNPFINRVDVDTIGKAVEESSGLVVTIEDHQLSCGMGAQTAHALSQAGISYRMKSLGIPGVFGRSAYLAEQLYEDHGLTSDHLVQAAKELIG